MRSLASMRSRTLGVLAVLAMTFGATIGLASSASAANTPMIGSWRHSVNPGTINYIYLVDETSATWPVTAAMNEWNAYLNVNHMNVRFAKPYYGTCSDANGILPRCFYVLEDSDSSHYPNLGTTWYTVSGDSTVQDPESGGQPINRWCSFKVSHMDLHGYPSWIKGSNWTTARESVIMHELGHALGLSHSQVSGDLMYESIDNAASFQNTLRTPSAADILAVNSAYLTSC